MPLFLGHAEFVGWREINFRKNIFYVQVRSLIFDILYKLNYLSGRDMLERVLYTFYNLRLTLLLIQWLLDNFFPQKSPLCSAFSYK